IIAIHGLGGHPQETWTEQGKIWLRDFVPLKTPNVRTLTFGYNSTVAFGKSVSNIKDFALQLLDGLRIIRKKATTRPLIFVCHSLGGIVFKKVREKSFVTWILLIL
ncbi:hypothetical protein GQ44DRAFT_633220, partial [Phaeosphaeriaceae sp. PMI808]